MTRYWLQAQNLRSKQVYALLFISPESCSVTRGSHFQALIHTPNYNQRYNGLLFESLAKVNSCFDFGRQIINSPMSTALFQTVDQTQSQQSESTVVTDTSRVDRTQLWYYCETREEKLMIPQYAGYFSHLRQLLQTLKYRMAVNWTQDETSKFLSFVDECCLYIEEWIFEGLVPTWEDYEAWLKDIKENVNPIGFTLYEERLQEYQAHINSLYGANQFKPQMAKTLRSRKVKEQLTKALSKPVKYTYKRETSEENSSTIEEKTPELTSASTETTSVKVAVVPEPTFEACENTPPQEEAVAQPKKKVFEKWKFKDATTDKKSERTKYVEKKPKYKEKALKDTQNTVPEMPEPEYDPMQED